MYDYIVIGKGLISSAAARYLSKESKQVALVGPDEPADWTDWTGHEGVFASHYDQGRITRILDADLETWGTLAKSSIEAYGELERKSKIKFHYPVGCLNIGFDGEDTRSAKTINVGNALGADFDRFSGAEAKTKLPFLHFPENYQVLLEHTPAGYINPRSMVAAQVTVAKQNGVEHINDVVKHIEVKNNKVEITTSIGLTMQANRVLVAAGAYSEFLLQDSFGSKLDLILKPRTIFLGRLSKEEAARLSKMPSIIFYEGLEVDELDGIYALPPIEYPDGHTYLKIGGRLRELVSPSSQDILNDWFYTDGDAREAELLEQALHTMIPDLKLEESFSRPCVVAASQDDKPIVKEIVANKVYVATAGNGAAAKSSDAIGKLAAELTSISTEYL